LLAILPQELEKMNITVLVVSNEGTVTAPDNAVFDPINNKWVAENEGVPPDIAVRQDAISLSQGKDPQLECAVKDCLLLLEQQKTIRVTPLPFSTPAKKK